MRISRFLVICLLLLLALPTPVNAEEVPSLPVDFTPGPVPDSANYISDTEYKDPTLHVTIETGRRDDCDYWVARVKIGHPSQLRTAAGLRFDKTLTTKGVYIARRQNAVLAINGDYYTYYKYGYIVRQGQEFRNKLKGERDVLAIDENGDFHVFYTPAANSLTTTTEDGKKLINIFHFGPVLVENGEVASLEASYWIAPEAYRQRMCIAQVGPLEYMCVCTAGSRRGSAGMTLRQFAEFVQELGAQTAYNLDGGDSALMAFNGKKINEVDNKNARDISDIIYFASAWDGSTAE